MRRRRRRAGGGKEKQEKGKYGDEREKRRSRRRRSRMRRRRRSKTTRKTRSGAGRSGDDEEEELQQRSKGGGRRRRRWRWWRWMMLRVWRAERVRKSRNIEWVGEASAEWGCWGGGPRRGPAERAYALRTPRPPTPAMRLWWARRPPLWRKARSPAPRAAWPRLQAASAHPMVKGLFAVCLLFAIFAGSVLQVAPARACVRLVPANRTRSCAGRGRRGSGQRCQVAQEAALPQDTRRHSVRHRSAVWRASALCGVRRPPTLASLARFFFERSHASLGFEACT